jgi:hypothetical protein
VAIKAKITIPKSGQVAIRLVECTGPSCAPKMDTLLEVLHMKDQVTERAALPEMAQPDENTVVTALNTYAGGQSDLGDTG